VPENKKFTLTLSCDDTVGIVAAVSGFMLENGCFILESAQMGDPSTQKFFMRTVFEAQNGVGSHDGFKAKFQSIATKFKMDWQLYDNAVKPRVLIMVSKQGHCLNDLLHRYASGSLSIDIPAVISNHTDMERLVKWFDIPFFHFPVNENNRNTQENQVLDIIAKENVDLTVLARYMQVLTPNLVKNIYGKAINIHHSFLPGFKGAKPYHQAYDRGVKIIGATAHYVSNELDEGPIIEQEVTRVNHSNTPDQLLAIGRDIESIVLSRAVKYHVEHRVIPNGNKTVVFG
jgi:formyltetrahydrofolate deformylase